VFFRRIILPRYIWKEVFGLYALGVLLLLILQTTDILTTVAGVAIRHQTPLPVLAQLVLYRLPYFIYVALPFSLPFAILLAFGRLAKDSELKVTYSAGIRPLSLVLPLVLFGVAISAISFVINNQLRPAAASAFNTAIWQVFYQQDPPKHANFFIEPDQKTGNLFYAGTLQQETLNVAGQAPQSVTRIYGAMVRTSEATYTAQLGIWDKDRKSWMLEGVWEVRNDSSTPVQLPRKEFSYTEAFKPFPQALDSQSFSELHSSLDDPSLGTLERRSTEFELDRRIADSISPIVFAFAASVLGLLLPNRSWAFASVIMMLFVYWAIFAAGPQLAQLGAMPPLLAAWLANICLAGFGLSLVRRLW
jgi:lipopolysaccharide export system permease protein